MMDVDFDAASKRFERDQGARRKTAEARKAQLQAERARQQAQQARIQQAQARRREEEAARQAEQARQHQEDLERNRGVAFARVLKPKLSHAAEAKGIVRRTDKLTLPPSASAALMEQHATKNGQLFFELSAAGARTHGSILDFTAEEGTVGVPPEMLRCLTLSHLATPEASTSAAPDVSVRYRFLKKGVSARVQPELSKFQTSVGNIKALLEHELLLRTTLTEGDRITVRGDDDQMYVLRVVELQPEQAVSLIDTDLEVDILPSVQAEEAAAAEAEAQRRLEEMKRAAAEKRQREEEAEAAAAGAAAKAALDAEQAARMAREQRREAAAAKLAGLQAADDATVAVAIRCPDGSRCTGRFR